MKVIVCDPISSKGIDVLKACPSLEVVVLPKPPKEDELIAMVKDAAALAVRSETKVNRKVMEAAPELKVVGRAGVGVDNVDVDAATERGVIVMNTPAGNTISTAELTFSMMMALARKIPQAHLALTQGAWIPGPTASKDRKKFNGTELNGKTLGVLGMGRIGSEVAKRALAFGMKVVAYDPYLTLDRAKELGVELVDDLDKVYAAADFITVHMPMTDETRNLVNAAAFAKMKDGVRLMNCARGGIINEADLLKAIESGKVAGAALDVYESEPLAVDSPLRKCPQIIMTPHLGASTEEAQENVGIEVAEQIIDLLTTGEVRNAVNLPNLDAKTYARVKPFLVLAEKLGKLAGQLSPKRNEKLVITYGGKAAELRSDPVTRSLLKGFLESAGGKDVNQVNVRLMAKGLGLLVEEIKSNEETDYNEWIHVAVFSGGTKVVSAGGTVLGARNQPRIVRLNSRTVEIVPEGVLFLFNNKDRPGMVGHIGTLMGKHNVNIASMTLDRDNAGGQALTVLNLDSVPPKELLDEIQKDPDISNVRVVRL